MQSRERVNNNARREFLAKRWCDVWEYRHSFKCFVVHDCDTQRSTRRWIVYWFSLFIIFTAKLHLRLCFCYSTITDRSERKLYERFQSGEANLADKHTSRVHPSLVFIEFTKHDLRMFWIGFEHLQKNMMCYTYNRWMNHSNTRSIKPHLKLLT